MKYIPNGSLIFTFCFFSLCCVFFFFFFCIIIILRCVFFSNNINFFFYLFTCFSFSFDGANFLQMFYLLTFFQTILIIYITNNFLFSSFRLLFSISKDIFLFFASNLLTTKHIESNELKKETKKNRFGCA